MLFSGLPKNQGLEGQGKLIIIALIAPGPFSTVLGGQSFHERKTSTTAAADCKQASTLAVPQGRQRLCLAQLACQESTNNIGGFKKAVRHFSVELPKPHSDTCFSGVQILGVHPAVTLTFGLRL